MRDGYDLLIKTALGPFRRFWDWWTGELADMRQICFKLLFKGRGRREADILHFRLDGAIAHLSLRTAQKCQELGQLSLTDETVFSAEIKAVLASLTDKNNRRIVVGLPREFCLAKPMVLPRAALSDIGDILINQIDRLTPYPADQVYFDYRLRPEDYTEDNIKLDIFIVPKARCAALLDLLGRNGLSVDCLEIAAVSERPFEEIYLAETAAVGQMADGRLPRGWMLAAGVCILAALPIAYNHYQISRLERNLGDSKLQARSSAQLKRDYEGLRKNVHFLVDKKNKRPLVVHLISEVSTRLGDDTWLEQLTVRKEGVQVFGYSATASGVLEDMEVSSLFHNARFLSAVVQQKDKNVARFQVAVDVTMPVPVAAESVTGGEGG